MIQLQNDVFFETNVFFETLLVKHNNIFVSLFMQASADLNSEVNGNATMTPYIVVIKTDEDIKQFFVAVERSVMVESDTFSQALQDLISSYFTFNIAYPKPLCPSLLFF